MNLEDGLIGIPATFSFAMIPELIKWLDAVIDVPFRPNGMVQHNLVRH